MCQHCYKEEIDQSALRTKIVQAFGRLEELHFLCADLEQALCRKTIDDLLSPDILPGEGLEGKALSLVKFFAQREMLPDLIEAVCNKRPQLKHYHFYLKYQAKSAASAHQSDGVSFADRLLTPRHFDLDKLVDTFLDTVRESQSVVGSAFLGSHPL